MNHDGNDDESRKTTLKEEEVQNYRKRAVDSGVAEFVAIQGLPTSANQTDDVVVAVDMDDSPSFGTATTTHPDRKGLRFGGLASSLHQPSVGLLNPQRQQLRPEPPASNYNHSSSSFNMLNVDMDHHLQYNDESPTTHPKEEEAKKEESLEEWDDREQAVDSSGFAELVATHGLSDGKRTDIADVNIDDAEPLRRPTAEGDSPSSLGTSKYRDRKSIRFGALLAPPPPLEGELVNTQQRRPEINTTNNYNHSISSTFSMLKLDMVHDFHDHYTLSIPSSVVRFRRSHTATRVIANQNHQLLLEESINPKTNQPEIIIKRMADGSNGAVQFLRLTYTLVCAFWTGFLLVFCVQVLLFLILNLAIEVGATSKSNANVGAAIGVILSIPIFIFGLSSALVIAGHYLADTWRGHPLIKNFVFSSFHPILTEWIAFSVYLGIPLLVMGIALLTGTSKWWEITSLVWFYCVFAFYIFFTVNVVWYEVRACWEVMRNRYDDDMDDFHNLVGRAILVRQVNTYSGENRIRFLASGILDIRKSSRRLQHDYNVVANSRRERKGLWTRLTMLSWLSTQKGGLGLFEHLEVPEPVYTVDEARGVRPYITTYTWSLEKFFCRPHDSRYIAVVRGPGALTQAQIWSSLVCTFVGTFLFILLLIGLLVWLAVPGAAIGFIIIIFAIAFIPRVTNNIRAYQTTRNLLLYSTPNEGETSPTGHLPMPRGESEGIYLVLERKRLTRPTNLFCWMMLVLEFGLLFLYPVAALFRVRNYPLALLFMVVSGISGLRFYVNAAVVLEETGHMDLVDGEEGSHELWKNQSRLNEIVGGITRANTRRHWNIVLGVFGFAFLALFLGAIGQKNNTASNYQYSFLDDFYYESDADLPYPTCQFGNGFTDTPTNLMVDYVFLAGLAYRNQNITQGQLDGWFGVNVSLDAQDMVDDFRYQTDNFTSAVTFKLIHFPDKNASIVAIRGTTNAWDELTDAQLWSAAFLLQVIREILPLGSIWTPILDHLVKVIKAVETTSIEKVSFYRTTTAFVKSLLRNGTFGAIHVTGHSLGGGLSIITGAQAGVPAIALSGPNARISKRTFDPPLSEEALNKFTFNIIPEHDIVPMIDDRARLYQVIRCRAPANNFLSCHEAPRSLCEILTTCGTGSRPAVCDCSTRYGFPPPKPRGNRTFLDACAALISTSPYAQFIMESLSSNMTTNNTGS